MSDATAFKTITEQDLEEGAELYKAFVLLPRPDKEILKSNIHILRSRQLYVEASEEQEKGGEEDV